MLCGTLHILLPTYYYPTAPPTATPFTTASLPTLQDPFKCFLVFKKHVYFLAHLVTLRPYISRPTSASYKLWAWGTPVAPWGYLLQRWFHTEGVDTITVSPVARKIGYKRRTTKKKAATTVDKNGLKQHKCQLTGRCLSLLVQRSGPHLDENFCMCKCSLICLLTHSVNTAELHQSPPPSSVLALRAHSFCPCIAVPLELKVVTAMRST